MGFRGQGAQASKMARSPKSPWFTDGQLPVLFIHLFLLISVSCYVFKELDKHLCHRCAYKLNLLSGYQKRVPQGNAAVLLFWSRPAQPHSTPRLTGPLPDPLPVTGGNQAPLGVPRNRRAGVRAHSLTRELCAYLDLNSSG